jgi:DNA-binding transcriptional LysR family regulator
MRYIIQDDEVMDLNLLRIFDTVMTERNMTRAAARLNITQPAVSNAVARLRDVLGDNLFTKVPGGITPTARALAIWPTIRHSLAQLEEVLHPTRFEPGSAEAMFRFAMSDYVADMVICAVAAELGRQAPGIRLHLRPHKIDDVSAMLTHGVIDLAAGVLRHPGPPIRALRLQRVTYLCAMRRGHPLAGKPLTREAFLSARHLAISLAGEKSLVDREFEEQGVQRDIVLTVNQIGLGPRVLQQTDLLAILPSVVALQGPQAAELHACPCPFPVASREISLLWHERNDAVPAHRWLRSRLIELCADET